MITRAYKYRLYPTQEQKRFFGTCFFINRLVYNYGLAVKSDGWEEYKKNISVGKISKNITLLKNNFDFPAINIVSRDVIDFTLKNLDAAFKSFFSRVKKGDTPGYPKFKSSKNKHQSFQNRRIKVDFEKGFLDLPRCKKVKVIIDRKPPLIESGQVIEQTATISRTPTGKFFISVVVQMGIEKPLPPKRVKRRDAVGIDYGIKVPFATSEGEFIKHPFDYQKWEKRRKRYARALSKKKKGSSNWYKAKLKLARHDEKMKNRKQYFLQSLSTSISNTGYSAIILEDLNLKGMTKKPKAKKRKDGKGFAPNGAKRKAGLNRKMLFGAFDSFKQMLSYKCAERGINFVLVDPRYTSQECPKCGHIDKENRDRKIQHKFICVACGHADNADVNAAINIKNKGLKLLKEVV